MNTHIRTSLAALAAFTLVATNAHANPGSLDPTFGTGGKLTTFIGFHDDTGYSVAVQGDGKIVVAGATYNGTDDDFALARFAADGSLDTVFGSGGKVFTAIGSGFDDGYSMALQADGKIVVAGRSGSNFAVARYKTDGSLDTSFSADGKVTTALSGTDYGSSMAISGSDQKIVVAGYSYNGSNNDFALVRYNTNGTLDATFGTGGKVTTGFFGILSQPYDERSHGVAIKPDGKIVVAGVSNVGSNQFALACYNSDGTLDTAFNPSIFPQLQGRVTTTIGSGSDCAANCVAVQGDGKIVAAGNANNGSNDDFALARYNADGSLDTTFGTGGKVTTDFGGDDAVLSLVLQADGKIVVAGEANIGAPTYFALARYNANGTLDATFGTGGKATTTIGSTAIAHGVALQADGKIVVAGESTVGTPGSNFDFTLARYNVLTGADTRLGVNAAAPVGDNIYNLTGAGQTLNAVVHHGGGVKTVIVCVQNDGPATDSFTVLGTPGNAKFKVQYLNGAANVTAAVTHGTFNTGPLAPGATRLLRAKITALTPLAGQTRSLGITSTAASDSTAKDVALIKAKSN